MADEGALRTVDVAREAGCSVQQVRDLERLRVLPPAERAANGYRVYAPLHVRALGAYQGLARAAGPVAARQLMTELWTRGVAEAAAAVDAVHAGLARERDEVLRAQRALRVIEAEGAGADAPDDAMTITELAAALGVRASTLRFWEREGLLAPERVTSLRARRYDASAIGTARIVAALRGGGYGIPAVREIVAALGPGDGAARARRVLDERLELLAGRSVALLRAGADLAAVLDALTPGPA
ncbi:MerR family transcriptional regulator [Streptomyces sp. NPDC006422]|uniref:MerR family transcriptional regulator n=1 Tax=unclassified Streptomyces TaxID=2593676 RepID=UPI0033A40612